MDRAGVEALHQLLGQLLEKARRDVVARLPVQHARLRVRQIQPPPGPRDRDVHQAAFLLEPVVLVQAVLVREQAFLEAADEHRVKLEALGRVHGHELQRVFARSGLVFTGLERRMRQERGECGERIVRIGGPAALGSRIVDLLDDEGRGGIDQFVEVLEPLRALLLGLVVLLQSAAVDDVLDDLRERQSRDLPPQPLDQLHEAHLIRLAAERTGAGGLPQAGAPLLRRFLQLLDAPVADAARGEIDHPQQRAVVLGIRDQSQVGERVLDLLAFEEAQSAIDPVADSGIEQRVLQHPRLRVRAIQQRHVGQAHAFALEVLHLVDDERGLLHVRGRLEHAQRFADAFGGPEILAEPLAVVRDERVRGVEDVAVGAVVLLELDDLLDVEVALEGRHVADVGAAKGIDALVVVAHREHRCLLAGQQLQPAVLQLVRVLELVHQDVLEARLVVRAQHLVALAAVRSSAAAARRNRPRLPGCTGGRRRHRCRSGGVRNRRPVPPAEHAVRRPSGR